MSVHNHFYVEDEQFAFHAKDEIKRFKESTSFKSLLINRNPWYGNPPNASVVAVQTLWTEILEEASLSQPDKKSTGMCTCKYCLQSTSILPKIYAEDHLALWCEGISMDERKPFFLQVQDKEGRKKKGREQRVLDLKKFFQTPPGISCRRRC